MRALPALRQLVPFALLAELPIALVAGALALQDLLTPAVQTALAVAAASALVLGLGWGLLQGMRAVGRLARLTESTRRIALQDFTAPVPVEGAGAEADLARAISDMAQHLGATLAVHQIFAQMDDAVLTKLDIRALIRNALRCVRHVALAEVAILGLFDEEEADVLHLFWIRKGQRNAVATSRATIDAALRRRIPLEPPRASSSEAPLPAEFTRQLLEECGVCEFLVMPVAQEQRAWGLLVAAHKTPLTVSDTQTRLLGGIATRLVAGFSGAERDRKLHSLAYVDPLTGLPNRMALQSLLAEELASAERQQSRTAVLFIDLDRFKQANDSHGHAVGDRLLVQAANRIRNNVREDDVVARIGGDEFTVLLGDIQSPRDAASVTRKLIQALSRRFEIDGKTIYTGASVGIAMYPEDARDGAELLKMADTAMYRAKQAGRSRFAFYEEPMNRESQRRAALDAELRQALAKNEFVLHFQPQIDLRTGRLFGVEALIRWQHPTRGLLYPKDFIDYAEETGLIPEIGTWVMLAACRQHQAWRAAGSFVPRMSVNVSNGQLPRSNFLASMRQIVADTEMPRDALEVEITESLLVEGGKAATEAIEQLHADGVLIAIDDFGTGYSSFSYLKTMPAKVLKLDMSFLVGATVNNDAGKIVAAIVNMAHALQKEVVAEGVENVEQLKLLKQLACERGQGFLFGKPVPADHIQRIFRSTAAGEPMPLRTVEAPAPAAPATLPIAPAAVPVAVQAPPPAPAGAAPAREDLGNRGEPATVPLPLADYEELARTGRRPLPAAH